MIQSSQGVALVTEGIVYACFECLLAPIATFEYVLVSEGGRDILPEDNVAARCRVSTTRNVDVTDGRGERELVSIRGAERLDVQRSILNRHFTKK